MNKGQLVFIINDRQDVIRGVFFRRESEVAVVDVALDVKRGITCRKRTHARFMFPDWSP